MQAIHASTLLRRALLADAAVSGATGLLLLALAAPLSELLRLPAGLLTGAGIVLLPFAAGVAWVGTRANPPRAAVWAVIVVNALWVLDSVLLLLLGPVRPNLLGYGFVIAQALAVGVLAELQLIGLQRSTRAAAAAA